jgi:hypothetical protein
MRKLHQSVDAQLYPLPDASVEVRFLFNGELAYVRTCPNRSDALAEAAAKRAELERDGWMFHW